MGEAAGFDFKEVDKISASEGGAPRAHVDALKLLATLVYYNDAKPENQRITCPLDAITPDGRCEQPFMMLDDMGATFLAAAASSAAAAGRRPQGLGEAFGVQGHRCTGNVPATPTASSRIRRSAKRAAPSSRSSSRRCPEQARGHLPRRARLEVPGEANTPEAWAAGSKKRSTRSSPRAAGAG